MRKRIEWIDIAKGMSIILVVYGHSGLASVPYIGDWFAAFRMPFFFFVSGILFSADKYPGLQSFIKRRWKTLIRPYFIFSFICMLAYCYIYPEDIDSRLFEILRDGWGGLALWFIPVLVSTEIIYFVIRKYSKNHYVTILLLLVVGIVGYISSALSFPNHYNLWFALTAVLFYGGGNLLSSRIVNWANIGGFRSLFMCMGIVFMLSLTYLFNIPKPEFFINRLNSPITYIAGFGGTWFMCCIAILISRFSGRVVLYIKRIIIFFGKNSYVVLAFHQVILLVLGKMQIIETGTVKRMTMWLILVALIHFINRYTPFVLGREPRILQR